MEFPEWPPSLTNQHLTNRLHRVWDLAVQKQELGFQFFYVDDYLFASDLSTGALGNGDNIVLTADSSKLYINVTPQLTDIGYIDLSIGSLVSHQEGRLHWDALDHTLEIDTEITDVHLQVGQENLARTRNESGKTIYNGQVVYATGATGQRPTIDLANASSPATSITAIGLATHTISNNQTGYVNTYGLVRDVCTSLWNEGDILWVDTKDGQLTNVRPVPPNFQFAMGIVARDHHVNGSIFVSPRWVPRLSWLSDVSIRGAEQDGDCIRWDMDGSTWVAKTPTILYGTPDSSAVGTAGEFRYDASYFYVCTSTNTWGRMLLEQGY